MTPPGPPCCRVRARPRCAPGSLESIAQRSIGRPCRAEPSFHGFVLRWRGPSAGGPRLCAKVGVPHPSPNSPIHTVGHIEYVKVCAICVYRSGPEGSGEKRPTRVTRHTCDIGSSPPGRTRGRRPRLRCRRRPRRHPRPTCRGGLSTFSHAQGNRRGFRWSSLQERRKTWSLECRPIM